MNGFERLGARIGLWWRLIQDPRVPLLAKLAVPLALLYVVSPIDIIPDYIVGLGQLDDLAIVLIAFKVTEWMTAHFVLEQHQRERGGNPPPAERAERAERAEPPGTGQASDMVIEGDYQVVPDGQQDATER
jgi:uncharacterized membrane protein YkvA (DUF1232 family)